MIIMGQDQPHMGGGHLLVGSWKQDKERGKDTCVEANSPFRRAFLHIQLHLVGAVSCGDNEILNYISLCDGASVSRGQRIIPGRCVVAEEAGN